MWLSLWGLIDTLFQQVEISIIQDEEEKGEIPSQQKSSYLFFQCFYLGGV